MQDIAAKLDEDGVFNPTLETSLGYIKQQRPDGIAQCSVLLRNPISDNLFVEYVVFGDVDSVDFFSTITVIRTGNSERIMRFLIDSKLNPEMFTH